MFARIFLFLWLFVSLWCGHCYAQQGGNIFSNIRTHVISTQQDTVRLDSMMVLGESLSVAGIDTNDYLMLPQKSLLVWKKKLDRDSTIITYRVLPLVAHYEVRHKSTRLIDSNILFRLNPITDATPDQQGFGESGKLDYNGSYGRSITVGNNQDVVLNSAFNLQASGYILDSIKLEAVLTDNTIPFQPEGNTQRLQEFDQIFIRLQKKKHSLQIGDYNLDTPPGYFLKYFKRVQGLYYQYGGEKQTGLGSPPLATEPGVHGFSGFPYNNDLGKYALDTGKMVRNSFGLSASMAKGQFARNIFQGGEGNQGPYKLTGNNGEQYFIVLAATERVYVDNVRMERGESADYIINYNTAEIRFMPRRMITKDSRIQVEFEYVDRNYLNSLIYAWDELSIGNKWNIRLQAYSNQDAKNQPYLQNLSGEQKRFLASIGDSTQYAFYPNIATDTFSASKILYRLADTVVNGTFFDSVFIYSTNPEEARYLPSFAYIGEGKGDYILSDRAANGRVYDWVAPVGGVRQGGYAPVQLLVAPKKQQVYQVISNYRIDSLKNLNIEVAASNNDPNLFATKDNGAHWGSALKLRYDEQRLFGKTDSAKRRTWVWQNALSYEYVQDRFQAVAPYRNVEFGRDWNVPQLGKKPDEHLIDVATSLGHQKAGITSYKFSHYRRGTEYVGYRNILSYDLLTAKTKAGIIANVLQATDTFQTTKFLRPTAYVEQFIKPLKLSVGGRWIAEHNIINSKAADTLLPNAFSFDIATLYVKSAPSNLSYNITYFTRADRSPAHNAFLLQNRSHNIELRSTVAQWHNQSFAITGTYRKLVVSNTTVVRIRPEETGLGRLEWNGTALKQMFTGNAIYEGGSGQEQKRAYTYVEVPAGQGTYTWNDYNGDGIQGANEFEIALYPDQKRYIRVLSPTNDYVKANYVTVNLSLGIEPAYYWRGKDLSKFKKFISNLSTLSSLQIANRLLGTEGTKAYNPFRKVLNNDAIISISNAISQSIYYNRNSAKWGIDYNLLYNAGKQLLTYGVEGSDSRQHLYKIRWSLTPALMLNVVGRHGARTYQSALDDNRSYDLKLYAGEPSLSFLYKSVWRTTATIRYEERANQPLYGGEQAKIKSAEVDMRYSKPTTGVVSVSATYTQIDYNGLPNKPITFTILDALQPGANYLWQANWERRVGKGIEVQLQYNGRKPGAGDVIHTGTMSIRAIL